MSFFQDASLGSYGERVKKRLTDLTSLGLPDRVWAKDASLWGSGEEELMAVGHRLGWLDAPGEAAAHREEYETFAREVTESGMQHVALLGMGGSSLCPEVLRRTFAPEPGHPRLSVLDSTEPASVLALEKQLPLDRTLFVVSTKSGTTIETLSFYRYFWQKLEPVHESSRGSAFVAITDPDSALDKEARQTGFRRVFPGPPTVGGRYSALTSFGLVPAALLGLDLGEFISRAERMGAACRSQGKENPGLALGSALGELALAGRNKVTFVIDRPVASLGLWLEQLLAESLGKHGKGLIPIADEPLAGPASYGDDRVFVHLAVGEGNPGYLERLGELEAAGHPVIRLSLEDRYDLAAEFFRWEFATAVAAVVIGVNAFDEPNVSESKQNTAEVLQAYQVAGRFEAETARAEASGVTLYGPVGGAAAGGEDQLVEAMRHWLESLAPDSYLAILAYLPNEGLVETHLQALRVQLRDRLRLATTLGLGPRYLHSTGQLHKGGPLTGAFIEITTDSAAELPIPGQDFGFATLIRAQALGDARSLASRDLPLLRFHLSNPDDISRLEAWMERLAPAGSA
jgi:glucose-6-phosphate isomerase